MEEFSTRQNKVAHLIQEEIADILLRMNKSFYQGKLISVTVVRVTKDLKIARIYLSIFPSQYTDSIVEDLKARNKSIRGELGRRLGKSLRVIPELEFYIDDSLDYIQRIDDLIKE